MKIIVISVIWAFALLGCFGLHKQITITSEYIINENWNQRGADMGTNSIEIRRMTVMPDSTINPFSFLSQADILNKLRMDSSFDYVANVKIKPGDSYKGKKIYFNRDNGFYWWTDKGERKVKILGKLQMNSWYEISRLDYYYYVVYIDSTDKLHAFVVNSANY